MNSTSNSPEVSHADRDTPPSGLRIVYFGTPEFAAYILRYLADHGEQIVGVVTTPDKPQGRGMKMRGSAVRETAEALGIPVLTPTKHRDPEFLSALKALQADLFVVVAYKILPREVYAMARLGTFNVHASLLPKYRGAAPINWAIIRGEEQTGLTTFLLDDQIDTGAMLLREVVAIAPDETAGELHDTLMVRGAELALRTIRGLATGALHPQPQSNQEATTAPKIFPPDCIVDFAQPAQTVHNFIRGLSPYPGAVTTWNSVRLKLLRTSIGGPEGVETGRFCVSSDNKRLFVGTASAPLEVKELQREGKRAMNTEEFLRGNRDLFAS